MEFLVECEHAAFGYNGERAVYELDWRLERGDFLCIAGENGSGKSTLLRGVLRLLPPLEGRLVVAKRFKRAGIGYLSQTQAAKNDFPASVREIVLSGHLGAMGLRPFFGQREKEAAVRAMEDLNITALASRCFRELSGGQQRRVLLARALCASRELLILDEPAAGLDPLVTVEMYALLSRLNKEQGITIIMVSHAVDIALQYANCVLHLKNRQLFFGTAHDYLETEWGKCFTGTAQAPSPEN